MKARAGDLVELSDGRRGRVETTKWGLVDGSTRYGVRIEVQPHVYTKFVEVDHSAVARITEYGQHAYWKPDARRVPSSECKRGHCYRCGVKKSEHE